MLELKIYSIRNIDDISDQFQYGKDKDLAQFHQKEAKEGTLAKQLRCFIHLDGDLEVGPKRKIYNRHELLDEIKRIDFGNVMIQNGVYSNNAFQAKPE